MGLKLSWDLFSVPRLSNTKSKQIQVEILKINVLDTKKENETQNLQMTAELQKALK